MPSFTSSEDAVKCLVILHNASRDVSSTKVLPQSAVGALVYALRILSKAMALSIGNYDFYRLNLLPTQMAPNPKAWLCLVINEFLE